MSGGIYTTRDRTRNLNQLTDVTLSTPTEGQALIYSNGVWTNGEGGAATDPNVFTISGNSIARNNGTYKRITYGCQGQYVMDSITYSNRWIQSGTQTNGGSDPDPGAMGIYEKEDDDGQFTSILFVYNGETRVGWCSHFGTQSFLDRHTVKGDSLTSEVATPHSTTFSDDGFTFKGPGTPLISSGVLQYSGGAGGVQVLNDLLDVASSGDLTPNGENLVLTYSEQISKWVPGRLRLGQYEINGLGDVEVIPSRRGILKDIGDGTTSQFQSTVLTLSLNEDVSDAAPSSNDILRWNSTESKWEPVSSTSVVEDISLGALSDVNLVGLATGGLLQFDGTTWMPTQIDLNSLTDVNAPTPSDGNLLTWDSSTSKWILDTNLRSTLAQEITDRTNADTAIQNQVTVNTNGLSQEVQTRSDADANLSDRLNDESRDRSTEDTRIEGLATTNASAITSEASARSSEDTRLGGLISTNTSGLAQEVTDRGNADTALQTQITSNAGNISNEVGDRTLADTTLQSNINNLTTDLSTEATARADEDTRLAGLISASTSGLASEVTNRTNADINLQNQINSNDTELSTLTTKVNDNTAAIEAFDSATSIISYTPPDSSRFELQLKTGLNNDGWVTFRNRLYDYSKLKSFQFTADTPYPWGKTGPTNGFEQSLNQSLFNGCAELRHAPLYYWFYEASKRTFWLMPGNIRRDNKTSYGWSYDLPSGSEFTHDNWELMPCSSGGALVNSLHRRNLFTLHTLQNTGRSTLSNSSDGVALQEFPLAFSITKDPYLMTDFTTVPIFQDNTWVEDWGLYATYSIDGRYLLLSRDGVVWDRVATGLNPVNVTSISIYPFGRGLGFAMQTSDHRYLFGVQPTPYHAAEAYYANGVGENFCSSGKVVMWWQTSPTHTTTYMAYSHDGLRVKVQTQTTDRIAGPWVKKNPDPRSDNPSTSVFFYCNDELLRYAYDDDPTIWYASQRFPFDSRQLIMSLAGGGNQTLIGGTPDAPYLTRSIVNSGQSRIIQPFDTNDAASRIDDNAILGEIGTTIETRTYAPVWACRNYFNVPSVVSFGRGVTWRGFGCALVQPYAFAHSDEMFVCVGYPNNTKGVIFYSTDAVNWYEAVNDSTIPIPGPGVPGISEDTASRYRFSDVYYETEHRRFVAFSQNRVGLSGDGINWTFVDMPDDPNNPGFKPIFQARLNGWNEYLRYGDAYYTRGGYFAGDYYRILALRISASGSLTFTDTGLFSLRERSRADTIANDPDHGQFGYPQWWATSLGIVANEYKGVDDWRIYTYSFPRESTTLTKSTTFANLGGNQQFYNVTTGFGGLIATGYVSSDTQPEKLLYYSPDGLRWVTSVPLGNDAQFLGVEYVGGEQYILSVNPTASANTEFRIAKGFIGESLSLNAPVGTITSPANGTNVESLGSRVLVSEQPTFTANTTQGLLFFTTEYRSCGVKPLAVVPSVGYANILGGGQNNNGGADTGSTPGLFISQPGSSYSLSQRYGLGHGSGATSNVPEGSLVEYELTPNLPINGSQVTFQPSLSGLQATIEALVS